MLTFTTIAQERILKFIAAQEDKSVSALRIAGDRAEHKLWLVKTEDKQANDRILDGGGFEVFIDPLSADKLEGSTVDFIDEVMQSGFRITYPTPTWDDPTLQEIQEVLDKQINPGIAGHGGNVAIERLEGETLYLSMGGGCQGCASAALTLRQGVEQMILAAVPEVKQIIDITDHAAGENPYYKASQSGDSPFNQ